MFSSWMHDPKFWLAVVFIVGVIVGAVGYAVAV